MAVLLDNVRARPALLSVVVAIAFHGAVVAALPHRDAHAHAVVAPPPQEVDVAAPRFQATPPAAPPLAHGAVAALGGGGASAPARALLSFAHRETPAAPAPPAVASPPADDFVLPQAPAAGPSDGPPEASGQPGIAIYRGPGGSSGPPTVPAAPPVVAPMPDRSHPATLMHGESWSWSCPWPAEADAIDDAIAVVQITVDPSGRASRVDIVNDPGYGFGREARKCALRETYAPAADRDGHAVPGTTKPIRVRFAR